MFEKVFLVLELIFSFCILFFMYIFLFLWNIFDNGFGICVVNGNVYYWLVFFKGCGIGDLLLSWGIV